MGLDDLINGVKREVERKIRGDRYNDDHRYRNRDDDRRYRKRDDDDDD